MGCDIHLTLEIKRKKLYDWEEKRNIKPTWQHSSIINSFSSRIYGIFAVLAGVRNYNNLNVIVPNRGFPEDATLYTNELYYLRIYHKDGEVPDFLQDCRYISQKDANNYVDKCNANIIIKTYGKGANADEIKYIEDIDYHHANWCTTQEMEECFKAIFVDENGNLEGDYIEWKVLLAVMKAYEESGEYECRAVYWFDN